MPLRPVHAPLLIGVTLVLLIVATRGQHAATWYHLPDATWAAFFLAGLWLRPRWVLPGLLLLVWGIDFLPFLRSGTPLADLIAGNEVYCLTPAYAFLAPAYSALWLAGRGCRAYCARHGATLVPLALTATAGAVVCELFSSGGFYWFSGRFADPSLTEFAGRFVTYFPANWQSVALYVGLAAVLQAVLTGLAGKAARPTSATAAR